MGKLMDLSEINMENPLAHWYYAYKFKSIVDLIQHDLLESKIVVDVGAGSALFSKELITRYSNLRCFAIDTAYELDTLVDSENISYHRVVGNIQGDVYLFTDVLEHVPNESDLLNPYIRSALPHAKFVITVPAFMSLWSGHDVYLKHYRRYKKKELNELLTSIGLRVIDIKYLYTILFPVVFFIRRLPHAKINISQMKETSPLLSKFILLFLKLDSLFSKIFPFGVSIIVLAEKS
jgi:hypothetical protein